MLVHTAPSRHAGAVPEFCKGASVRPHCGKATEGQAMKRFLVALSTAALLAVLAGGALAAPASAATGVFRGTDTYLLAETLTNDCLPGVTGTLVGTLVIEYQNVNTAQGLHSIQTQTAAFRIEWSNGTYAVVKSVDHTSFTSVRGTEEFTDEHRDSGSLYTTGGEFLSPVTFHLIEHHTITDGVVRVDSVKVRGGC
jgi:uncharacterized membrane protein